MHDSSLVIRLREDGALVDGEQVQSGVLSLLLVAIGGAVLTLALQRRGYGGSGEWRGRQ